MKGNKSLYLKKGLLPIVFLFLFLNLNLVSANFPPNSLLIQYNFSDPNNNYLGGILSNTTIANRGIGSSGTVISINQYTNSSLFNQLFLNEVIPYNNGSNNTLENVYNVSKNGGAYIMSNVPSSPSSGDIDTNTSFSFLTWFNPGLNPDVSQLQNILDLNTTNNVGNPFIDFFWRPTSANLNFSIGTYGGTVTSCTTPNFQVNVNTWYQIGFVYIHQGIISGDIIEMYMNGVMVSHCSNSGLSGGFDLSKMKQFVLGSGQFVNNGNYTENFKMTDIWFWNYRVSPSVFVDNFAGHPLSVPNSGAQLTSAFGNQDVTNTTYQTRMNEHFNNYNNISVTYHDGFLNGDIHLTTVFSGNPEQSTGAIIVRLTPELNNINLTISSGAQAFNGPITVKADNPGFGSWTESFNVVSNTGTASTGSGFFGVISSAILSLFPDNHLISASQKIVYVLITLIIFTFGILFIVGKEHAEMGLYSALILDAFAFIFFVTIGYISVGILVLIILIALGLTAFKLKGGGV